MKDPFKDFVYKSEKFSEACKRIHKFPKAFVKTGFRVARTKVFASIGIL
jgi:hypothetical protein